MINKNTDKRKKTISFENNCLTIIFTIEMVLSMLCQILKNDVAIRN